jgi:hypothetical protein
MTYGCQNRSIEPYQPMQDGWTVVDVHGVLTRVPRMIDHPNPWGHQPPCGHTFRRDTDPGCEGCSLR